MKRGEHRQLLCGDFGVAGLRLVVAQLHHQNSGCQRHRNGVGDHDGPGTQQQPVDQPQRHTRSERAVHAQRDAAHVFGLKGVPCLGHEAGRGQEGSAIADPVRELHGGLV